MLASILQVRRPIDDDGHTGEGGVLFDEPFFCKHRPVEDCYLIRLRRPGRG